MKQQLTALLFSTLALGATGAQCPVGATPARAADPGVTIDSTTRDGYTLLFCNHQPGFDTVTKRRMTEAFFEVYPKEVRRFNTRSARRVVFTIDPSYEGVAETGNDTVRYNPRWLKEHPEDIDVVTHEVMHIVQDYRFEVPGWLTEGIADYARYVYGVNNAKGNWKLPDLRDSQHYTDAYRVTARFLLWIEQKKRPGIVDSLDKAARSGNYTSQLWAKLTNESLDQLWEDYKKDPIISGPLSHAVNESLPGTSRLARGGR